MEKSIKVPHVRFAHGHGYYSVVPIYRVARIVQLVCSSDPSTHYNSIVWDKPAKKVRGKYRPTKRTITLKSR